MRTRRWMVMVVWMLCGVAARSQTHVAYLPHFTFKNGEWITTMSLNNPGPEPQNLFYRVYDDSGLVLVDGVLVLEPEAGIQTDLRALTDQLEGKAGWISWQSECEIQGLAKFSHLEGGGCASLSLVESLARHLVFPIIESGARWNSGFALTNPHDRSLDVAIVFTDLAQGHSQVEQIRLQPHGKYVGMADALFAMSGASGFITVESPAPILGLALTFSSNQDQILAVPATAEDQVARAPKSATRIHDVAAANNQFAFDLFHSMRREYGNLFISPYSISVALGMTFAGARGQTEREMARTLGFSQGQSGTHAGIKSLTQALNRRGAGALGTGGKGFRLNIIQSLWVQDGYSLLDSFTSTLDTFYGAPVTPLDFATNPEASRIVINDWVEDETEDRIQDLIPAGELDAMTRLVLVNAIYFNAAWTFPFPQESTRDDSFTLLDGNEIQIPMMSQEILVLDYAEGEDYQAVAIPYDGGELAMLVILPADGHFDSFENRLGSHLLSDIQATMAPCWVQLRFPKFQYASDTLSLKSALMELGMPQAFQASADLSGMNGFGDLMISDVFHKTFLSVDEAGTEAAAATAVTIRETAIPDVRDLWVNRPFLFAIQDLETQTILFWGRILDPTNEG